MGGCRCSYKNCPNTTKTTENVHFFHYPVKQKERCAVWINNAQKPEFCDLEEDQLRNKVICEYHFENKWFPNPQKKRLVQGAIPTLDGPASSTQYEQFGDNDGFVNEEVQVLPANEDGTIFVLDTDHMFNKSQKVESYIYKNGMIVPAEAKKSKDRFNSDSLNAVDPLLETMKIKSDSTDHPHSSFTNCPSNILQTRLGDVIKREEVELVEETMTPSEVEEITYCREENQHESPGVYKRNVQSRKKAGGASPTLDKTINKNYWRTINQHTRDIANIKKLLQGKTKEKLDVNTALQVIKDQLPPSLFTILNLCLNNRYELNDDDIEFFTKLHTTSPEAYNLLADKYRWDLPAVDIVETPME